MCLLAHRPKTRQQLCTQKMGGFAAVHLSDVVSRPHQRKCAVCASGRKARELWRRGSSCAQTEHRVYRPTLRWDGGPRHWRATTLWCRFCAVCKDSCGTARDIGSELASDEADSNKEGLHGLIACSLANLPISRVRAAAAAPGRLPLKMMEASRFQEVINTARLLSLLNHVWARRSGVSVQNPDPDGQAWGARDMDVDVERGTRLLQSYLSLIAVGTSLTNGRT